MNDETILVEAKASSLWKPNAYNCKTVKRVSVGTEEYYDCVPSEYRTQLLHKSATFGVHDVLLLKSALSGMTASILIHFDEATISEYLTLSNMNRYRLSLCGFTIELVVQTLPMML